MQIELNKKSTIYIACPSGIKTGGPEALHQLYYYMCGQGYNCKMVYFFDHTLDIQDAYKEYASEKISLDEVIDSEHNVLIVPESSCELLANFKSIRKCIWWLSVLYSNINMTNDKNLLVLGVKDILKPLKGVSRARQAKMQKLWSKNKMWLDKSIFHFVASKFAYEHVCKLGFEPSYLVEPISKPMLTSGKYNELQGRQDVILYNASKNTEVVQKLIERYNDLTFLPLKGYNAKELVSLFRTHKLYIDFGGFPGPERLPKEVVYNGCIILVGRENAADNNFDIMIDEQYKIAPPYDIEIVYEKIKDMLGRYEQLQFEFNPFAVKVDELEQNFIKQINENFVRK